MSESIPTGNDCGTCTVCCMALRVIEMDKEAGRYCKHCLPGKGCGIYETRFEVCRTFLCGWRLVPQLDAAWRPDKSGILMLRQEVDKLPEAYRAAGPGVNFVILGGEKAILTARLRRICRHPGHAQCCGLPVGGHAQDLDQSLSGETGRIPEYPGGDRDAAAHLSAACEIARAQQSGADAVDRTALTRPMLAAGGPA